MPTLERLGFRPIELFIGSLVGLIALCYVVELFFTPAAWASAAFHTSLLVRQLITMLPAFVVVALGVNSTSALVISQVVLSIALPLPMISLLLFTSRKDIMGRFVKTQLTIVTAVAGTMLVLLLNIFLILKALGVPMPISAG